MAEATLNNLDQDRMIAHAFFVLVALLTRALRKTLTEIEVDVRSLQAAAVGIKAEVDETVVIS